MRLLLLLALVSAVSSLTFKFNFQYHCVDGDQPNCRELVNTCQHVLVPVKATPNVTLFMCVELEGVRFQEVGVTHYYSLVNPYGKWQCQHTTTREGTLKWGTKTITLTVLAKGFGVQLEQPDALCDAGAIFTTRIHHEVAHVCVSFKGFYFDESVRLFILSTTPDCSLVVQPLVSETRYVSKPEGRVARIVDEL
uniref:ORF7b protein n=1 Tax=Bat Coronavirus EsYN17 TaxID=3018827 RepID=A0AA49IAZ6_9NIDO|nr:ORF7b protein [Bat Coronavirus EsYN17]